MKDFVGQIRLWCEQKILLWKNESEVIFKEGEVWWCRFGINVGEEIYGKGRFYTRPVLAFRKFTGNSFLGLPLTGQGKTGSWYVPIQLHSKKSWVLLNQARILDKKRLTVRIGTVEEEQLRKVRASFVSFYSS